MQKHFILCVGLFCLLFLAVGCGDKCGLKGKIVFSDDKTPLDRGEICLVSDKGIARGSIDKNGHYVVGSVGAKDGLPAGSYRIYFTATEVYESPPGGGLPTITPQIDLKYGKAETSGLTVEVKKSMTFDIEVDRYNAGGTQKKR